MDFPLITTLRTLFNSVTECPLGLNVFVQAKPWTDARALSPSHQQNTGTRGLYQYQERSRENSLGGVTDWQCRYQDLSRLPPGAAVDSTLRGPPGGRTFTRLTASWACIIRMFLDGFRSESSWVEPR